MKNRKKRGYRGKVLSPARFDEGEENCKINSDKSQTLLGDVSDRSNNYFREIIIIAIENDG